MTALATDNFNRANSTGLGANWTVTSGQPNFNVSSNTAVPSDLGGADDITNYTAITWPNNHYSKCQVTVTGTGGGGQGLGPAVRSSTSANTQYRGSIDHAASGNAVIAKCVGGSYSALQTATVSWTDGDTFEMDANGTTITYLRNGSSMTSTVDSSITSGNAGLCLSTAISSGSVDNWEGGDFSAAPTDPFPAAYRPWIRIPGIRQKLAR